MQPVACRSWFECTNDVEYAASIDVDGSINCIIDEAHLNVRFDAFGQSLPESPPEPPASKAAATGAGDEDLEASADSAEVAAADFIVAAGLQKWDEAIPSIDGDFVADLNEVLPVVAEILPQVARLRELYRLVAAFKIAQTEARRVVELADHAAMPNIAAVAQGVPCVFNEADGALCSMPAAAAAVAVREHRASVPIEKRAIPSAFTLTGDILQVEGEEGDAWEPSVGTVVDA